MKKMAKSLIAVASLLTLVGCGDRYYITNGGGGDGGSGVELTPVTFAQQCELEGIKFTYVDPNPDFTKTEGHKGDGSITTGGSGKVAYESIDSCEELQYRMGLKYTEYYWEADDKDGVTTIKEAAALEDAKYMTELFPNDGKAYSIKSFSNAIGTKAVYSADIGDIPCLAVIGGFGMTKEGDDFYLSTSWLTAGNTTTALLNTGKGSVLYYEYNYASKDKSGPGTRNYGCKINFEIDFGTYETTDPETSEKVTKYNTYITTTQGQKGITEAGNAPDKTSYLSLAFKCKITALHSLG